MADERSGTCPAAQDADGAQQRLQPRMAHGHESAHRRAGEHEFRSDGPRRSCSSLADITSLDHAELDRISRGLLDLCFVRFEIFDDDLEGEDSRDIAPATSPTPPSDSASPPIDATAKLALDTAADPSKTGSGARGGPGSESSVASSTSSIDADSVAAYAVSVGALQQGYRHLPLYDHQLSQFLFSTLFVRSRLRLVGIVDAPPPSKSQ